MRNAGFAVHKVIEVYTLMKARPIKHDARGRIHFHLKLYNSIIFKGHSFTTLSKATVTSNHNLKCFNSILVDKSKT